MRRVHALVRVVFFLVLCVPAFLAVTIAQAPAAAPTPPANTSLVVYEGARLIPGDGSPVIENATFVVAGSRFAQMGPAGSVLIPGGATRVNLAGKTVMPAIIDTHTHLSTERAALIRDLQQRAYWGIGTVMSLGLDPGDLAFTIRDEAIPNAARLRTAGRGITRPEEGRTDVPYWINTPDEARKAVWDLYYKKVDLVKIWVDDRNGKYQKLTPELYTAIIQQAHDLGLRVIAHIFTLEDAKGLVRAGVDAFAHGVRDKDVDDEFVALVKEHPQLVLAPNLPDRGVAVDMSWLRGGVSAEELKTIQAAATDRPEAQQTFGIQARNLARLSKEGMTIALGTDGNTPWAPHVEMADMVAAGMTPAAVITAATRNGAALLRLKDTGTVAPGSFADFLVLDGNPLEDITNTRKISAVYLKGVAVSRASATRRSTH